MNSHYLQLRSSSCTKQQTPQSDKKLKRHLHIRDILVKNFLSKYGNKGVDEKQVALETDKFLKTNKANSASLNHFHDKLFRSLT